MTPEEIARKYFIEQIPVDVVTDKRVNALIRVIADAISAEHARTLEECGNTHLEMNDRDVLGWDKMTQEEQRIENLIHVVKCCH